MMFAQGAIVISHGERFIRQKLDAAAVSTAAAASVAGGRSQKEATPPNRTQPIG